MKHRPDTAEGVEELKRMLDGERIIWMRQSRERKRDMVIYPETLTPEQRQRIDQIEQELLELAHDASEETKTSLKGKS